MTLSLLKIKLRLILVVFAFILLGFLLFWAYTNEHSDSLLHNQQKILKFISLPSENIIKTNTTTHIPTRKLYRAYLKEVKSHITTRKTHSSNVSYVDFLLNFSNVTIHYLPNVTLLSDSIKIHDTIYDRDLKNRTFKVDYEKNEFFKDGEKFWYASGEMHYFRSFSSSWRRKMRAMRAAGFRVISTYIEWSTHNPQDNDRYIWTGLQDVEKFIRMAMEEDLLVILRPAERNGGGLPHWLIGKYSQIDIRTMDSNYLKEVRKWFAQMMPRFIPYLYENGGPIILIQVENEYGAYGSNRKYQLWMRDEIHKYVRDKAVLFTNDIKDEEHMKRGKIDGVLATTDFNDGSNSSIDKYVQILRKYQPDGPCVNSQFNVGWSTHFDKSHRVVSNDEIAESLSVNIHVVHGGTNFGFTSSTEFDLGGYQTFLPPYDALMNEAGDMTDKYHAVRNVIKQYFPMPNIDVPENEPRMTLPSIKLRPRTTLFSSLARHKLGSAVRHSKKPLLFENFIQDAGFLLYETQLNGCLCNSSALKIPISHDRAIVYLNNTRIGTLSRKKGINSIHIDPSKGDLLQILVEHLGRLVINETKGIIGNVTLNNKNIEQWSVTSFPFANFTGLKNLLSTLQHNKQDDGTLQKMNQTSEQFSNEPIIFDGTFDIENDPIRDTFIDTRGWGKGFIYINGFSLGRYWPLVGPLLTMYLPKDLLKKENNSIVLVELEQAPLNSRINFLNNTLNMEVNSNEV